MFFAPNGKAGGSHMLLHEKRVKKMVCLVTAAIFFSQQEEQLAPKTNSWTLSSCLDRRTKRNSSLLNPKLQPTYDTNKPGLVGGTPIFVVCCFMHRCRGQAISWLGDTSQFGVSRVMDICRASSTTLDVDAGPIPSRVSFQVLGITCSSCV